MKHFNKRTIVIIVAIILILMGIFFIIRSGIRNFNKEELEIEQNEGATDMKMNISLNGKTYEAILEDNETVKKLLTRLPLEITMQDLNANEKYYYFEESFPNSPKQVSKIEKGDIMLYGNNCLVIFYESFKTSYSYTRIGKIKDPSFLETSLGSQDVKVKFQ